MDIEELLQEEGLILRDTIRKFCKENITLEKSLEMDKNHEIDKKIIKGLSKIGIFGAQLPEKYEGYAPEDKYGNRVLGTMIQEELSYYDSNIALCIEVSTGLAAHCILLAGSEEQKQKYIPKLARGEMIGAFALSEPNSGSDASALQSKVENNILNGTKQFITNGKFADLVIWFAKSPTKEKANAISAFILDKYDEYNIKVEENLGQKATGTSQLSAQDLELSSDALLKGKYKGNKTYENNAMALAYKVLDDGRLHVAGDTLGLMKRAIDESINYANQRKTFGKFLSEHQTIQNKIADMIIGYETARNYVYNVASEADKKGTIDTKKVSIAKIYATETMYKIVDEAVQIHGGIGLSEEHILSKLIREARAYRIFEGANEINKQIIAKYALK